MDYRALFTLYTNQVLQWQLGTSATEGGAEPVLPPPVTEDLLQAQRTAERLLRALSRAQHKQLILLGVGDGTLASLLAEHLPPSCTLLVLDDSPQRMRQALQRTPALFTEGHTAVAGVDSSPWALLLLCKAAGFDADHCTLSYHPACRQLQATAGLPPLEQWRRLFLGSKLVQLAQSDAETMHQPALSNTPNLKPNRADTVRLGLQDERLQPSEPLQGSSTLASKILTGPTASLSLACIAHPEETLLADFLAQVPPWVAEVVLLWDSVAPAPLPPCAVPVRQHVRPLNGDFAAQRNALLSLCRGEWCLYLDVDEALSPQTWATLPAWMALRVDGHKAGAVVLPRETFMGGTEAVRMGYGLWPDVQVRLFPLQANLRFEGAVHERLTGLSGPLLLAGGHALLHYSHARKSRVHLAERLQVFDQAAGQPRHVLSEAYPCLPIDFFTHIRLSFGTHSLLQLPPALHI